MQGLVLWVAQGFGLGRIPFAPGTFGSLAGLLWFLLLLRTGHVGLFIGGVIAGLAASVVLCSGGERILEEKDPSSIVFDEIAAFPICFVPAVLAPWHSVGSLPPPEVFVQTPMVYITIVIFVLFRVIDIAKVWPAAWLEGLPGGWGITADDVLAACYVAIITLFFVVS